MDLVDHLDVFQPRTVMIRSMRKLKLPRTKLILVICTKLNCCKSVQLNIHISILVNAWSTQFEKFILAVLEEV